MFAGAKKARAHPNTAAITSSSGTVADSVTASPHSSATVTISAARHTCSTRRRSLRSADSPAGSASPSTGRNDTSPTMPSIRLASATLIVCRATSYTCHPSVTLWISPPIPPVQRDAQNNM